MGRPFCGVVLAASLGLSLLACSDGDSLTDPASFLTPAQVEAQLVAMVNGERSAAGVEPQLNSDTPLSDIARRHSQAMRDHGFFGHVGPQGDGLAERLRKAGVSFRRAAENLARVSDTADPASLAHEVLMSSAQHRDNVLDPSFRLIGVGVASSNDSYWITQIFVEPK